MELLHPPHGRPLIRHSRGIYALTTGVQVGVVVRGCIHDRHGRYLGTIDHDCLVHRPEHRHRHAKPFMPAVLLLPETLDELADLLAG